MRGLGEKQSILSADNKLFIFELIGDINGIGSERFATINDLHRESKISKDAIRNHIKSLLKEKKIFEYKCYNNSRGFIFTYRWTQIKNNALRKLEFYNNTEKHINSLKFPPKMYKSPLGKKLKPRKERLKSGREIQRKKSKLRRK